MQALPPPRRTALSPSPVVPPADGSIVAVPLAEAPESASDGLAAADPRDQAMAVPETPPASTVAPLVPAPRHELPGGGSPGFLPRLRSRPVQPDAVVFTASCPACGADAIWSEEREDTRLRAAVDCPCG
jgi:hypothetical protein